MSNNKKSENGVITVLVSLMLIGILSIGTLVLEVGRFQAAKTQLADATISAATSMIAAYDDNLYSRYGLLAIDTTRFNNERATDYVNFNSDIAAGYTGNRISVMYSVDGVDLASFYNLTNPSVLERQILSRSKYHVILQDNALNSSNVDSFLLDYQRKCQYVADKMNEIIAQLPAQMPSQGAANSLSPDMQSALSLLATTLIDKNEGAQDTNWIYDNIVSDNKYNVKISNSSFALLPSQTGTIESNVSDSDADAINDSNQNVVSVLGYGFPAGTRNPTTNIDISFSNAGLVSSFCSYLCGRDLGYFQPSCFIATKINTIALGLKSCINSLMVEKDANLLLNSYITNYFSNRTYKIKNHFGPANGNGFAGSTENANFAAASVEYLFGGKQDEILNQKEAYNYLLTIRFINNLYLMLNNPSYNVTDPWQVSSYLTWAVYESIVDMELLTDYGISVPFNKKSLILDINNPTLVKNAFANKDLATALKSLGFYNGNTFVIPGDDPFSYSDSLTFALWFVPNSQKILRIADLIQLEMRYREQYVEKTSTKFLMSNQNTYCRVKCVAEFNPLLPIISLGNNSGMNNIYFESIKFAGY